MPGFERLCKAFSLLTTYQTCAKLPLLQAVINETLRRYPTIIATLPRMAVKDTIVAGIPVRAGVSFTAIYLGSSGSTD